MPASEKRAVFERYGLANTGGSETAKTGRTIWRSDFEVDHLVSLELGGSNAIENLWPESYVSEPWNAHVKDRLENKLHRMVCDGDIPLADAQRALAIDWIAAYRKYVGGEPTEMPVVLSGIGGSEGVTASSETADNRAATAKPAVSDSHQRSDNTVQQAPTSQSESQRGSPGKPTMGDFFVFRELPWLRRVLAYVLGLGVLWLLASLIAFLLVPVLHRLRGTYRAFLDALAAREEHAHQARVTAVNNEIEQLRAAPYLRKSLRRSGDAAIESDEVSSAFQPFFSAANGARAVLADARASFDHLRDSLVQTSVTAAQFTTAIPSAAEIQAAHNTKRREAVHLVVGLLLLAALMTVNTGMLSQILKDLEIVPAYLKYGSFQLYFVFAFLLTAAEAGTGVLFGYLQHRVRRDAPTTRLAPLFAVLLVLGMAFVEASFYSRVGSSSSALTAGNPSPAVAVASGPCTPAEDTICAPGIDTPIRFSSVMFCWGFVLVMVMFGCGMMVHNAYTELTKDAGLSSLRRRLGNASKAADAVIRAMRTAEESQSALLAKSRQVVETFTTEFALNGSPEMLVKQLTEQWKPGTVPAALVDDKLSVAEMRELELRAVFWWWTALVSVGVCAVSLQSLFAGNNLRLGVGGAAFVFVLLAFGLGLDLSKQDIVAGLTSQAQRLGRRQHMRRAMRGLAIIVLGGLTLLVLLQPSALERLIPWFLVTATATVVVFAGRELAPWFAFVVIHLRKVLSAAIWLLGKVLWLVLSVLDGLLVVAVGIGQLLAAPMTLMFGGRPQAQS